MRKTSVFFWLGFLFNPTDFARPVDIPKLPELAENADLVAIIQPISTAKASDRLISAPGDPAHYQGLNTQFHVLLVLKASPALPKDRASALNSLTLLHFFYSTGDLEFNGGLFAYFSFPPTLLQTTASNHPNSKLAESPPAYLAFLKWHKDGRFRPVTGDYDSAPSFRILTTPFATPWFYESDHILDKNTGTNQTVKSGVTTGSPAATNPPPAAAKSPR